MTNKTSSSMSKLLANASKMEKEIKETEKVADTISSETADDQSKEETKADHQDTVSEKEILPEKKEAAEEKGAGTADKKQEYQLLFQDKKIKETEIIRISKETHTKLKKLSNVTGISMHVLATNILELTFEKYSKEIQAAIKKYMSL